MMDFLKSWVMNIVTLGILIVIFEILVPSGKIKKFVNLVAGFILIIAIINPFLGYFNKGVDLKDLQLADSNFMDQKELEQQKKVMGEKQMQQIIQVYRDKISKRIKESVEDIQGVSDVKVDIVVNEDFNSEKFGEIQKVYLELLQSDGNSGVKPVSKVEKIAINRENSKREESTDVDSKLKSQVEDRVSKLFEIDKENIVVNMALK